MNGTYERWLMASMLLAFDVHSDRVAELRRTPYRREAVIAIREFERKGTAFVPTEWARAEGRELSPSDAVQLVRARKRLEAEGLAIFNGARRGLRFKFTAEGEREAEAYAFGPGGPYEGQARHPEKQGSAGVTPQGVEEKSGVDPAS